MQQSRLVWTGALALALVLGLWGLTSTGGAGGGKADGKTDGFPRYSVIHTEGFNLIVTDNQTNTTYFYSIEKDAEVGDDLHLRGSINLADVGKPLIKPKVVSKKK